MKYPLDGQVQISTGVVSTPYYIYNGFGLFVGGTCDLGKTQALLKNEVLQPVQTSSGEALMGIWICNFSEASLGPHHELQFSIFVSERKLAPVSPHPLGVLKLMSTHPDAQMLCHGLWNDTPQVVAYNRDLLCLNAAQTSSRIE